MKVCKMYNSEGIKIYQRESDGFINVTDLFAADGKKLLDYINRGDTNEFIEKFSAKTNTSLTAMRNGYCWAHPELAMYLSKWCSPLIRHILKYEVLIEPSSNT